MHKILQLLAGAASLFLLASCASSPAVRTEIVEVPVEVQVPLDPALTRDVPPPPAPPRACTDPAAGLPTICTDTLPDWINALNAWGEGYRGRMAEIRAVQPKGD